MATVRSKTVRRLGAAALLAGGLACNQLAGIEDAELEGGGPSVTLCSNTCQFAHDGECDDGGPDADYPVCNIGSDCGDCGERVFAYPDTDVGIACVGDSDCSSISAGYCPPAQICTRHCTRHSDCGCAADTTNGDISAGRCPTACAGGDDTDTGFCFRVCGGSVHCATGSSCELGPGYGICLAD